MAVKKKTVNKKLKKLTEAELQLAEHLVWSADPPGYDVAIKQIKAQVHKLTKHIRYLQSKI